MYIAQNTFAKLVYCVELFTNGAIMCNIWSQRIWTSFIWMQSKASYRLYHLREIPPCQDMACLSPSDTFRGDISPGRWPRENKVMRKLSV